MTPTYSSPGSRAAAAILALYVGAGACLLAIGGDVRRIVIAQDLEDGRALVDALLAADQLVSVATLLALVTFVAAAVFFLRWQVAAQRNLPALGEPRPRASVGAGVAAWFVPGVNLFRPLQLVGDLWRAGERGAALPLLLRIWWIAWLTALAAVAAAWLLLGDASDVAERQRIDGLRAVATALAALAAGLTIVVVTRTTNRQETRAIETGAPRPVAAPPPAADVSEGGLRVVSEEQARRSPPDA